MKLIISALLLLFCSKNYGQNRSNIWMLGTFTFDEGYPKCGIDFTDSFLDTFSLVRPMGFFDTNASICDTNGHLLFYTNGIWVSNANNDTLMNSENFNPGFWTDFYSPDGLGCSQCAFVIPRPEYPEQYFIFYVTGELLLIDGSFHAQPMHLSVSKIDLSMDGGLGAISADWKNQHIVDDTLVWGRLTACKHANGKDWWIISHKGFSDLYYKFLVTPDTIIGPFTQHVGSIITEDIMGMGVFSPDGSRFAYISPNDTLDIFNFDRCTGEFSNSLKVVTRDSFFLSVAFSPNSRYLYAGSLDTLLQFDMSASNIDSSQIVVGAWDSTFIYSFVPTYFFQLQLAPDGKIYMGTWNSTPYLHYIDQPDSGGLNCNFMQHSIDLPYFNIAIPNFPNYDLDSLPGSDSCNAIYTATLKPPQSLGSFKITPNPVSLWLNVVYNISEDASFGLFDLYGKKQKAISLFHYFKNRLIDVSDLPAGVYLAVVSENGEKIWSEKVVIAH